VKNKVIIAVLAYVFSSLGFLFMLQMIIEELRNPNKLSLIALLWLSAWTIHLTMTIAWVKNRKLKSIFPISGTILGLVSLLWPLLYSLINPIFGYSIAIQTGFQFLLVQATLVLPCILLAIWLVKFHISKLNNA
jgi:hypothetical protein